MQIVSLIEVADNLNAVFDAVYLDNEEIMIYRNKKENIVVIPFNEYHEIQEMRITLQENQEDLNAFEQRKNEPTLSYEELLRDLKVHGKL